MDLHNKFTKKVLAIILLFIIVSCSMENKKNYHNGSFGYDVEFLNKRDSNLIILKSEDSQSQIAISAKYQAKVFTSTANGLKGQSLGFIGYDALSSSILDEHMNAYGGENRFWLGPEGGQYSLFFEKGAEQIYDNWHTPKDIDSEEWSLVYQNESKVKMKKEISLINYLDVELKLEAEREIRLFNNEQIQKELGLNNLQKIHTVGYSTSNSVKNLNDFDWDESTGSVCIWILDMFIPAPKAITFIPYSSGTTTLKGAVATTDYFGDIPKSHLKISDSFVFLKTDGNYRSKLGLNEKRTIGIAGNYDPDSKRLTVITFDVNENDVYLNQEWNPNKAPLLGDAMNAYNDGPLEDGSIMGPFFELESVSPAAFISPNESISHLHNVFHFMGEEKDLNPIALQLFNLSLENIKNTFND